MLLSTDKYECTGQQAASYLIRANIFTQL